MVLLRRRSSNTPARVIKLHGRGSHKSYLSVHRLHSSGRGCDATSIDLPSESGQVRHCGIVGDVAG